MNRARFVVSFDWAQVTCLYCIHTLLGHMSEALFGRYMKPLEFYCVSNIKGMWSSGKTLVIRNVRVTNERLARDVGSSPTFSKTSFFSFLSR